MHGPRILLAALALAASPGCGIDLIDSVQDVFREDAQADLQIRVSEGSSLTCSAGPSVVVAVENRGEADAAETITAFVFVPGGSVDVRTGALDQAQSIQLDPVHIPASCFVPDCRFTVLADASFQVDESEEGNNRLDGTCPASAAP